MNLKKLFFLISFLILIIGGVLGYNFYSKIYKPNTTKEGFLYIPSASNFEDVENLIRPFLKRVKPFTWVATKKNYPNTIKPGKYHITKGLNNNELINLLRSGKQTTVKLSFNNQDTLEKLAGRIAEQIEPDSIAVLKSITNSSFITEVGFTTNAALSMYIQTPMSFIGIHLLNHSEIKC